MATFTNALYSSENAAYSYDATGQLTNTATYANNPSANAVNYIDNNPGNYVVDVPQMTIDLDSPLTFNSGTNVSIVGPGSGLLTIVCTTHGSFSVAAAQR